MSPVPRVVSLTVLVTLIIILGITFFQVVAPFLLPLFLAAIVALICQPLFRYFVSRTGGHVRVAAGLTTASLLLGILIPIAIAIFIGTLQVYTLTRDALDTGRLDRLVANIRQQLDRDALFERVRRHLPVDSKVTDPEERKAQQRALFERYLTQMQKDLQAQVKSTAQALIGLAGQTVGKTVSLAGAILSQVVALAIFVIALYYFLADGPALIEAAESMIPVHIEYQRELLREFEKAVRAVVMATFLAAITQGAVTSLLLFLTGRAVGEPVLCHFFIYWLAATLAALIPLAGTGLVWGPAAAWLLWGGHWGAAVTVGIVGVGVVGTMDNVIRVYMLQSDAKLHPLLAFVSVLGGLRVLGIWGVFIGPIVACCLHALVKIFNEELKEFSRERFFIVGGPDEVEGPSRSTRRRLRGRSARSKHRKPLDQKTDHRDAATPTSAPGGGDALSSGSSAEKHAPEETESTESSNRTASGDSNSHGRADAASQHGQPSDSNEPSKDRSEADSSESRPSA
ncbi:MAG: AI-2E family transporter [Planctomycetes bacterium]|nr:AI-2E family transporter [Planctomycetota bacterium]